jgi:hypothetical protein
MIYYKSRLSICPIFTRINHIKRVLSFLVLLGLLSIASNIHVDAASSGMVFLIQNKWGGIHGVALDRNLSPSEPAVVRPNIFEEQYSLIIGLEAFSFGGYQLTTMGKVFPVGEASMSFSVFSPIGNATSFVMAPEGKGGWIAAKTTIKKIGRPPRLAFPSFDSHGLIKDMEYDSQQQRLAVLCEDGAIAVCDISKFTWLDALKLEKDKPIDIEFIPKGFLVLTELGRVYFVVSEFMRQIPDLPQLGKGLACDLEISPLGNGFYILDRFGVIHACDGAPPVPTEPLTKDAAVDLEILLEDKLPRWDPPGIHTQVGWNDEQVLLDPQGPPKQVSITVEKAEHMTGFMTQISYDPQKIILEPHNVRVGSWWDKGVREARIKPSADHENGQLILQGSGVSFPFEGASGGGDLARLAISPMPGVTETISAIEIENFYFWDSYQVNIDHSGSVINSCTVYIAPIQPRLDFLWENEGQWLDETSIKVLPGDIVRADIVVENGSRIRSFEFGFSFPNEFLRFLGMSQGSVWRDDISLIADFDIPSKANENSGLRGQLLKAQNPGACQDQKGSIASLFFAVSSPGKGKIQVNSIQGIDDNGDVLKITSNNTILSVQCD